MTLRRVVRPRVHMVKGRTAKDVETRCGQTLKLKAGQALPDIGVSGWETQITCPACKLSKL